jgi:hypothetical protein
MNAPCKYIADVASLVKEMPQYVHIMNLEFSPAFSYLSIPKVKKKKSYNNIPSRNQVGLLVPPTLAQIRTEISQSTPH